MAFGTISCPKCNHPFTADQAMQSQMKQQLAEETKKLQAQLDQDNAAGQAVLEAQRNQLLLQTRKLEIATADLAAQRESVDQLANTKAAELMRRQEVPLRKKIQDELEEQFKAKLTTQTQRSEDQVKLVQDLQEQLIQVQRNNGALEARRLELERTQATLREQLLLENAQKLAEERTQAAKEARGLALQESELTIASHRQKEETLQRQLMDLQRKLDQGSQQEQGESLELELQSRLSKTFRSDQFEEVAKGRTGADILQHVYIGSKFCGSIAWEAKNAKNWSHGWIQKLKEDQRAAGADLSILVTVAPSPGDAAQLEGVFICNLPNAILAATVARDIIIKTSQAKAVSEGRVSKAEEIYNFITSEAFRQVYESNLKTIDEMRKGTHKLRNSMNAYLSGQETQLQRLETNFTGMYGSIRAITENASPEIAALEFDEDVTENQSLLL
jgi:hypothetical protein